MARKLQGFQWVLPTTPQKVAQRLIVELDKETPEILVGWQSHLVVWCDRMAPWLMEKILQKAAPLPKRREKPEANRRQAKAVLR